MHSDDPWNQTAADNAEWLQRFKRSNGLLKDGGPLLTNIDSWSIDQGGMGFAPPCAWPNPCGSSLSAFPDGASGRCFPTTGPLATNSFIENMCSRYARPATIFCSRELEEGLVRMSEQSVAETGCLPSVAALRTRAREILGDGAASATPADDPELMDKFLRWMMEKMPNARMPGVNEKQQQECAAMGTSFLDAQVSDEELGSMLQDMEFDLAMGECDGGVSLTGFKD